MTDADVPIKYMDRTHYYYRALGYTRDYIWATFDDVPFSQLAKPLSDSRIALITTASPVVFDGVKRVDAAVLCPLCPVCHQTVSLVARHLEANGIPTVIVGSALDVVEHCGVPRFYFTDFPLGNPCGHPWRPDMQREIVRQALTLFQTAKAPRTTVKAPFSWKEDGAVWRARYGRVDPADKERLLKLGEERRRQQAMAKQNSPNMRPLKHKKRSAPAWSGD
jgi:hypothetical protein